VQKEETVKPVTAKPKKSRMRDLYNEKPTDAVSGL